MHEMVHCASCPITIGFKYDNMYISKRNDISHMTQNVEAFVRAGHMTDNRTVMQRGLM